MNKLHWFLLKKGKLICESTNSSYYEVNGIKIRVSDHLAQSDVKIHIILPSNYSCGYFGVYIGNNTKLTLLDYEELKLLIKTISIIPEYFDYSMKFVEEDERIKAYQTKIKNQTNMINQLMSRVKKLKKAK